jgi:hypothetical protein
MLPEPSMTSQMVGTTRDVTMFCFAHWPSFKPLPAAPLRLTVGRTCEPAVPETAGAAGKVEPEGNVAVPLSVWRGALMRELGVCGGDAHAAQADASAIAHAANL